MKHLIAAIVIYVVSFIVMNLFGFPVDSIKLGLSVGVGLLLGWLIRK